MNFRQAFLFLFPPLRQCLDPCIFAHTPISNMRIYFCFLQYPHFHLCCVYSYLLDPALLKRRNEDQGCHTSTALATWFPCRQLQASTCLPKFSRSRATNFLLITFAIITVDASSRCVRHVCMRACVHTFHTLIQKHTQLIHYHAERTRREGKQRLRLVRRN